MRSASRCARRSATARRTSRSPTTTRSEGEEWMYGRGSHDKLTDSGDWREHIVLTQHRYMLEDVRIGLSFLVSVRRTGRRADAARARVPVDRRRDLRRGFHEDRADIAVARRRRPRPQRAAGRPCNGDAMKEPIACLGAGRMGRGIAVVFAYAGHNVALVDFKPRDEAAFHKLVRRCARRSAQCAGDARRLRAVRSRRPSRH